MAASASDAPAMPPPPGVTPNFVDPPNQDLYSTCTIAVCTSLVTITFALRCYVRIFYKQIWTFEDWCILLSWIGTAAFAGILGQLTAVGGGKHLWDITPAQAEQVAYWFNIVACEYAVTILMTKVSILVLYRRAFSPRKGSTFETIVYILIAIHVGYYGATLLAKIWECTPRSKIIDPTIPGTCISIYAVLMSDGIFNTVTDFFILLMPTFTVYRLQMDSRKKLLILMVFTFGLLAPAFSVVGFYVRLKHGGEPDVSWNLPQIVYWGGAEVSVGTMCVCLPELGVLFNQKSRPRSRPSESVLYGRRADGGTSNEYTYPGRSNLTDSDGPGKTYFELDDEHKHFVAAGPTKSTIKDEIPEDSVHVQYDVRVESQRPVGFEMA